MGESAWIRSIVIVGGGSAGWMTAAALSRALGKDYDITVVESEDIGVVGVGEATIPPIKLFNAMLGLDEAEFMRETRAAFKLGIEFRDWGALGQRYFHPFGTYGLHAETGHFFDYWLKMHLSGQGRDLADYSLCSHAAYEGRMGMQTNDAKDIMSNFGSAYHFDTILYGKYLRKYAQKLGVKRIEGMVVSAQQNPETGFVTGVTLKSGQAITGELFIDCSGFKGLLIEGALKTGYEDWSHYLPMNQAIAIQCEFAHSVDETGALSPYTTATAREAGWQWRIPLQHRIGNGYVHSSQFISEDEATSVLLNNLDGEAIGTPRTLRFVTGRRKKFWSKNVVAIGLSSGFLEPLESTSIHLIQASINKLLQHFPDKTFAAANIEAYNQRIAKDMEIVRDFLILHYHTTKRDDAPLWNYVRNMDIPESLALKMALFKARGQIMVAAEEMFTHTSWLAVMMGQGLRPDSYSPLIASQDVAGLTQGFEKMYAHIRAKTEAMPSHVDFLRRHNMFRMPEAEAV